MDKFLDFFDGKNSAKKDNISVRLLLDHIEERGGNQRVA